MVQLTLKPPNVAQILSLRNVHTYIDVSICICERSIYVIVYICMRCEVIIWAKFGLFRGYNLGQVGAIFLAKVTLAYSHSGLKRCFAHSVIVLCFFCPIIKQVSENSVFCSKIVCQTIFPVFLFVNELNFETFSFWLC